MRLIVTPGTVLRWHRDVVRRRWPRRSRHGRSGRPPVRRNVRSVVLRLARESQLLRARQIVMMRRAGIPLAQVAEIIAGAGQPAAELLAAC
jgi:hypothetical protein